MADNFWSMGDTGPCGPCSEIYYFNGDGEPDLARFGEEPTPDGSGWVEIWNLVFMQFERAATDGTLDAAARAVASTPAWASSASPACVQGVRQQLRHRSAAPARRHARAQISRQDVRRHASAPDDVSMRVIADHARTTAFLIAEGVFPDRDGREYVLRRVMRRAIRHGHRLGIERAVPARGARSSVVELMGDAVPGAARAQRR